MRKIAEGKADTFVEKQPMGADPKTVTGLSASQVDERVAQGKTNDATEQHSRSLSDIIRANTITSFNIVIGIMWLLMFIARAPIQDSLFGFIIIINSAIGIVQEYRAKRTLERLSLVGEAKPVVLRAGVEHHVRPNALVLDDVIKLSTGDQLVVDGEIISENGLEIDESLLTGEADPVEKMVGDTAMSGSFVVAGTGFMRATQVGDDSYATRLANEAKVFSVAKSELMSSIMKFVRVMSYALIPIGLALFWSQLRSSTDWMSALSGTVAGAVTMIPEGLVLLTSVAMALAVIRLGQRNALVQEMPAVETLARVDVICVDKTGTLTEPGMKVRELTVIDDSLTQQQVGQLLGTMAAAETNPNPTVIAIADAYATEEKIPAGWRQGDVVPFSSARKWSGFQIEQAGSDTAALAGWWVFGAPDILCHDAALLQQISEAGTGGARMLLLARCTGGAPSAAEGYGEIEPVAYVSINQVLRADAAETVRYFLDQNVQIKVISGDNPTTVAEIAQQAGIPQADDPVDANTLPEDQEQLAQVLDTHGIFGRVTPAQKRAMVSALQSKGHVVAMTGDGVNDVLALKDADLGIAMGSGAGATRSVAQLVLLDDKFSVMPAVVAEGRRVLGNIERVADLFLTKSFYAAILALVTALIVVPFPFLPRHLTLVTAFTIGTPAFLLALMPNKQVFQPGFLKRVLQLAIPGGIVCTIVVYSTYAWATWQGDPTTLVRATATVALFTVAWWILVLVAQPMNLIRAGIVALMATGFVLVLVITPIAEFFAVSNLGTTNIVVGLSFGMAGGALMFLIRIVTRKIKQAKLAQRAQQSKQPEVSAK